MPPKPLDPVGGRPEKPHIALVLFVFFAALGGGHVAAVFGRLRLIEDRWIIATVEGDIGLDKELAGKQAAAVAEQDNQDITRILAGAPRRRPRLDQAGQAETSGAK